MSGIINRDREGKIYRVEDLLHPVPPSDDPSAKWFYPLMTREAALLVTVNELLDRIHILEVALEELKSK